MPIIQKKYFSLPVEILWMAQYSHAPGWSLPVHTHDFFQIMYCISGNGMLLGRHNCRFQKKHVYLYPPEHAHGLTAEKNFLKIYDIKFLIHEPRLYRLTGGCGAVGGIPIAAETERNFNELFQEACNGGLYNAELCSLLLTRILLLLLRGETSLESGLPKHSSERADTGPVPRIVLDYIFSHFKTVIKISDLAMLIGITPRHLSNLFRNQFSMAPAEFIRDYRLSRARELLLTTNMPVTRIAENCGFENAAHFSRLFHSVCGIAPARWRLFEKNKIGRSFWFSEHDVYQPVIRKKYKK